MERATCSSGLFFLLLLIVGGKGVFLPLTAVAALCDITEDTRIDQSNHNLTVVPSNLPENTCYLDLSHNMISALDSHDLAHLTDLCVLRMTSCGLSYVSPKAFRANSKVQELYLASNRLSVIPELPPLPRIRILDLSENVYESYALRGSFQDLKSLNSLSLGSPNAKSINCSDLTPLRDLPLKQLKLGAGVGLRSYQPGSLSQVLEMQDLTLNMTFCEHQEAFRDILTDLEMTKVGNLTVVRFLPMFCNVSSDLMLRLRNLPWLRRLTFRDVWFNSSVLIQTMSSVIQSPVEALTFLNMTYKEDTADGFHLFDVASHSRLGKLKAMVFNHYVYQSFHYPFKYPEVQVNTSLFRGLKKVKFSDAGIGLMPCGLIGNLPVLEELDLSNNLLQISGLWYSCPPTDIFPALRSLILKNNKLVDLSQIADKIEMTMKCLKKLDLSVNPVKLGRLPLWPVHLQHLSLSGIELGQHVFAHLSPDFLFVNLSQTSIASLAENSLQQLTHLRTLVLSYNNIEMLPLNWTLLALEELFIDYNRISTFQLESFKGLPKLKRLHGGNNPFVCDCALHTFLTGFDKSVLVGWPLDYKCHSPPELAGTLLSNYHPSRVSCELWIQISISLSVIVIILLVIGWIFRAIDGAWYLHMLWVWLAVKQRDQKDASRLASAIFLYDAFISYSQSDAHWVESQLVPHLEGAGFHLCLHERDFVPGRWIIDNIVASVEQSRHVLFVLSQSFVRSEWCTYELFFAQHRALGERSHLRQRDSLAFVLLEPIPPDSLPRKFLRLRAMLRQQTYLQWPQEEAKRWLFWTSLRAMLGGSGTKHHRSLVLQQVANELALLSPSTQHTDHPHQSKFRLLDNDTE